MRSEGAQVSLDIWLTQEIDVGSPDGPEKQTFLDKNITHNLTGLWSFVGVYDALYMSDGQLAGEHAATLAVGVDFLLENEAACRTHDAPNGWGKYDDALPWLREVAEAFRKYPKATIRISK